MRLIYIAGPFTAVTPWGIEANIRAAEDFAAGIIAATEEVSCVVPHSMGRHFVGRAGSPAYWYAATMRQLEACDGVAFVEGWWESTGSRAEFRRAVELGLPVYFRGVDVVLDRPATAEVIARVLKGLAA